MVNAHGGEPVADPGWSRNRVCQKSGDHRKRKEPGDFASDSFFSERRDPMRQRVLFQTRCGRLPAKISGPFEMILRDAAQEMEDTGGENSGRDLHRNPAYKEIFIREIPEGRRGKKKWRFFGLLGRRLGCILTEKCR